MATTIIENISRQYRDLDLNFIVHPVKKDINKNVNEMAVINSIKNIVLTNRFEKPFDPDFGSDVRRLLFENLDTITASVLEREIETCITNYEPRVILNGVSVSPDFENNSFKVDMQFSIENTSEPVTISFLLERLR
jgi:phage baseplate assembly protein W